MSTSRHTSTLATLVALAGLGLFHLARPLAVSAQSATARAEATVVVADAAWAAHAAVGALAAPAVEPEAATRALANVHGTLVWLEPVRANAAVRVVTVAHLAH